MFVRKGQRYIVEFFLGGGGGGEESREKWNAERIDRKEDIIKV